MQLQNTINVIKNRQKILFLALKLGFTEIAKKQASEVVKFELSLRKPNRKIIKRFKEIIKVISNTPTKAKKQKRKK